jgi:DNA repair protein RecO (recombination protein O)
MALVKDTVLIIKSINYSEADKILTVFGRMGGKYTLFARGVRKLESKNRGNIQTMSLSKVSYYEGANMGTLRETEALYIPDFDISELKDVRNVLYMFEKLLAEGQKDEDVFDELFKLYKNGFERRSVNRFRIKILEVLGFLPDLHRCSLCGSDTGLKYFETETLSLVCDKCYKENKMEVNKQVVKVEDVRYESERMDLAIERYIQVIVNS